MKECMWKNYLPTELIEKVRTEIESLKEESDYELIANKMGYLIGIKDTLESLNMGEWLIKEIDEIYEKEVYE